MRTPSGAHAALSTPARPAAHRVVLSSDGRVVDASEGTWSWLGVPGDIEGADARRLLDAAGVLPDAADSSGAAFSRVRRPDGRVVEVAACRLPGGGHSLVLRDAPATTADGAARRMLSMAAHELRTPLTVIEGAARTLRRREELPAAASPEVLDALERGIGRLSELIHAVLEAGALAAGTMKLKCEAVDAAQVATQAVEAARAATARTDITLRGAGVGPVLVVDRKRLQWMLRELIVNAAKCSEPGTGIELDLVERGRTLDYRVSDRGRGVPEDLREAIFEPFRQADSSVTRAVPGLGLGLAICRGVATLHGGSVAVETAARTTTFILRLPMPAVAPDPQPLAAFPARSLP